MIINNQIKTYTIKSNEVIADNVFKMVVVGDNSWIKRPGQFINIDIEGAYLKRPISISEVTEDGFVLVIKIVGFGTKQLSLKKENDTISALIDLGNGFDLDIEGNEVVLIGGGVGVPPLLQCAKDLKDKYKTTVILGFNSKSDVFYENEFKQLGSDVYVTTVDGSYGHKGVVTEIVLDKNLTHIPYLTCGPEGMLKAVSKVMKSKGQLSFEARMGCGFGACMGCSCKTLTGYKRICKEGPVLSSEELIWND